VPTPEGYRIPPQHEPVALSPTAVFKEYVRSEDLGADAYFVKDIQGLEGTNQRWTHAEPEFRFYVKAKEGRRLHIDFSIHEVTFRDTGPVTIACFVNGNELGRARYDAPGRKAFDKAVPAGWLLTGTPNRVLVQVLNPWRAPDDVRLGILLHGAGFVR
jgi:hypothetical protein